jgi:tRNA-modifying protein YgfZ
MSRSGLVQECAVSIAHLADRGVVRVTGEEAKGFLDGLLTCDLDRAMPGRARYGALLTPQGKILFDFIVFAGVGADGGYLLDCAKAQAQDLAKRLGFYKLRAKVVVTDLSDVFGIVAGWGDSINPGDGLALADDPRLPALGWRAVVRRDGFSSPPVWGEGLMPEREAKLGFADSPHPAGGEGEYHAHRIALGVPEGGKDFVFGDAFPHEALMDQLHGVDFDKGCYVGQEVVARMEHRGTARTRIVPLVYLNGGAAEAGAEVTAGERSIGKTGSSAGVRGLAMVRLDRAAEAIAAGATIRAGNRPVRIEKPAWATFSLASEAATPAA